MKYLKLFILSLASVFLLAPMGSCKKKVSGNNTVWVGTWENESGTEVLIIQSNGSADWSSYNGFVAKSISGRVVFSSGYFLVKTFLTSKKFTIGQAPTACDPNVYFYDCTYAYLNGEKFLKQ
jgi:hypothetical protein